MSVATPMQPWDTYEYQRIVDAHHQAGHLVVRFGDRTVARVDVAQMDRVQERDPDWDALTFDEFQVVVPTQRGDFEIPWFPIRSMSDPAFRAHLDAMAAESARWVGQRVRELRRGRGLTVDALAERARVSPALVATIERGAHDGDLGELERVVGAMDHDMRELIRPEAGERDAPARTA